MASYFNHVFAGERVRPAVECEYHLVEQTSLRVDDLSQMNGVAEHVVEWLSPPSASHDVYGFGAAHPYHGDAPHARWSGNGTNGVGSK